MAMGIDIYLNGYEEYEKRTKKERAAFDRAVKKRDRLPRGSAAAKAAQQLVLEAADKMWDGSVGYLRSSYNGSGLFRVLEEIFGFDVAALLFPGEWKGDVKIDGCEFSLKVTNLKRTAALALSRRTLTLPWINEYTEVTGNAAPDPNPQRSGAELFGDSVFEMLSGLGADKIEGGPSETNPTLQAEHRWYLTEGLNNLSAFGELAERLNREGQETFAYISY